MDKHTSVSPTESAALPCWQLLEWHLDCVTGRLSGPDGEKSIEPRVMALLIYLINHHGQVISRRVIHDEIWQGVVVSDDALHYSIAKIRQAFGDDRKKPRFLETLPRRGYRWLVAPVAPQLATHDRSSVAAPQKTTTQSNAQPRDPKRRLKHAMLLFSCVAVFQLNHTPLQAPASRDLQIAVMPVRVDNDTLVAEAEHITEGLTRNLAEYPALRVIGSASVLRAVADSASQADAAHRIGADYYLTSRYRVNGQRRALSLELISTGGDRVRWGSEVIVENSASSLYSHAADALVRALKLTTNEPQNPIPANLSADYLSAIRLMLRRTPDALAHAITLLNSAHLQAPDNARIQALLADALALHAFYSGEAHAELQLEAAQRHAESALQKAARDAQVLATRGHIAMLQGDHKSARHWLESAVKRAPHDSRALHWLGELNYYRRDYRTAQELLERAIAVDPLEPVLHETAGLNAYMQGDFSRARKHYQQASRIEPTMPGPWRGLAQIDMQQGSWGEALANFHQAVKKGYRRSAGYLEIAALQLRLGNIETAQQWLDAALSLGNAPRVRATEHHVLLARLGLASSLQGLKPDNPNFWIPTPYTAGKLSSLQDTQTDQTVAHWSTNLRSIRISYASPLLWAARDQPSLQPALHEMEARLASPSSELVSHPGSHIVLAQLAAQRNQLAQVETHIDRALQLGLLDLGFVSEDPILGKLLERLERLPRWQQATQKRQQMQDIYGPQASLWHPPEPATHGPIAQGILK